jgi:hypothetical protein
VDYVRATSSLYVGVQGSHCSTGTDLSAAQHTAAFCWSGADFVSAALLLLLIFSIAKDTIAQTQLIILITHT